MLSEKDFISFITQILKLHSDFKSVESEVLLSKSIKYRADLMADQQINGVWEKILFEVCALPILTSDRLQNIAHLMQHYISLTDRNTKLVFIYAGIMTEDDKKSFNNFGIGVWDKKYLSVEFQKQISQINIEYFQKEFSKKDFEHEYLIKELEKIAPGKPYWSIYQKQIKEILTYLFDEQPIAELPDMNKVNRRDFILPNRRDNKNWTFIRDRYKADFIVIDAKNFTNGITKKEILQISNYLKPYGTGLFGVIFSRKGESDNAKITRKELWITYNKMIVVLDDNDVENMINAKNESRDPMELIIKKIEDFRIRL